MSPPPAGPPFLIAHEADHTAVRFGPGTSLTEANAEEVGRQLLALVEGRDKPALVVDLAGVEYLTSIALTKFITLNGRVRAAGGRLALVNLNPSVRQVFAVTRLDKVLDVRAAGEGLPA